MIRIAIDPNVRTRSNGTYVAFEDVPGEVALGDQVIMVEPESGLEVNAKVTDIDFRKNLVFFAVDWSSARYSTEA